VLLSMSGFITAATISSLFNFNGILISFIGIIVEIIGIGFSYWLFTTFFQAIEEEISEKKSKK
jgi:ABC-type glycerol-3-phosphate transport system permease component